MFEWYLAEKENQVRVYLRVQTVKEKRGWLIEEGKEDKNLFVVLIAPSCCQASATVHIQKKNNREVGFTNRSNKTKESKEVLLLYLRFNVLILFSAAKSTSNLLK